MKKYIKKLCIVMLSCILGFFESASIGGKNAQEDMRILVPGGTMFPEKNFDISIPKEIDLKNIDPKSIKVIVTDAANDKNAEKLKILERDIEELKEKRSPIIAKLREEAERRDRIIALYETKLEEIRRGKGKITSKESELKDLISEAKNKYAKCCDDSGIVWILSELEDKETKVKSLSKERKQKKKKDKQLCQFMSDSLQSVKDYKKSIISSLDKAEKDFLASMKKLKVSEKIITEKTKDLMAECDSKFCHLVESADKYIREDEDSVIQIVEKDSEIINGERTIAVEAGMRVIYMKKYFSEDLFKMDLDPKAMTKIEELRKQCNQVIHSKQNINRREYIEEFLKESYSLIKDRILFQKKLAEKEIKQIDAISISFSDL